MRTTFVLIGILGVLALVVLLVRSWGSGAEKPAPATAAGVDADATRYEIVLKSETRRYAPDSAPSELNSVSVTPRDGRGRKKDIPGVEIRVDGVPLRYVVGTGNYYDRHPHFRLRDDRDVPLRGGQAYAFTIRLPGGEEQPLAVVRMPSPLAITQIQVPARASSRAPLPIRYSDFGSPVELVVVRTLGFVDEHGNAGFESGSPNQPEALRRTLTGSGVYEVPVSFFHAPPGRKVASVGLAFTARATGTFRLAQAAGSSAEAIRRIELEVEVGGD